MYRGAWATMVIFLSTGMLGKLQEELMAGGYPADTPAAIVYKATWPEEKVQRCMVSELEKTAADAQVTKTAPYFLTRREMGIFNVGGPGVVRAGDAWYKCWALPDKRPNAQSAGGWGRLRRHQSNRALRRK